MPNPGLGSAREILSAVKSGELKMEDQELEKLLAHPIPDGKWSGELGINDSICQMYYAKSALARLVYKILTSKKKKSEAKGKLDLNILFIYNIPFRSITKISIGAAVLQGLYKTPIYNFCMNMMGQGVGMTVADIITMLINCVISFWVFFPTMKVIFKEKNN